MLDAGPASVEREESLAQIASALDVAAQHELPIIVVQHELPAGAPVFAAGSTGQQLHPDVDKRVSAMTKRVSKANASIFAGTDVASWLQEQQVDCITLVGYMTNNCVIGSAAAAEERGIEVEVLSDATGAINITNDAGSVSAAGARDAHGAAALQLRRRGHHRSVDRCGRAGSAPARQ